MLKAIHHIAINLIVVVVVFARGGTHNPQTTKWTLFQSINIYTSTDTRRNTAHVSTSEKKPFVSTDSDYERVNI